MSTYLFITKRTYKPKRVAAGLDIWWSCSSTTRAGDSALVYVTGVGIQYEWRVTSDAVPNKKWKYRCDVEHLRTFEPPISFRKICEEVTEEDWKPPHVRFRGYRSIKVPEKTARRLRRLRLD